jgi:nucleoside-diphosphate-sugar epimerase
MAKQPLSTTDLNLILNETRTLWDEMRNQRLFITGGTGFFGCWLVESFAHINRTLDLNAHATILTRSPRAFTRKCPHLAADPAITLLAGDVRNFEFPSGDFPFIIHAATEASAVQLAEDPQAMLTTILEGTDRTLQFASTHNTRKLLFTSSGAVYGPQPPNITHVPEDYVTPETSLKDLNIYAQGKRTAEEMCAQCASQFPIEIKIARCFAFVGPHLLLDAHFAIGNFLRNALHNQSIAIAGDGTPLRSYLYAADLAIWLWTILFRAPSMQPINVGSEEAISIADLASTIIATLNPALEIKIARPATPGVPPLQYVPSTQRARQQLGLKQLIPLEEAIRRTAAWHTNKATL